VVFNIENKEKMAVAQKSAFENRLERIPASPVLRSSINAVKRYTSNTGHFRFDAERTEKGHADEFWAGALCTAASQGSSIRTDFTVGERSSAGVLRRESGTPPRESAFTASGGF
jgi:phage FluMu gp28-like protein